MNHKNQKLLNNSASLPSTLAKNTLSKHNVTGKSTYLKTKSSKSDLLIYGKDACFAVWRTRPDDIIRVYLTEPNLAKMGPILTWCASHKKAYHIVTHEDLDKITKSAHHGGFGLLTKIKPKLDFDGFMALMNPVALAPFVFIDGVSNPHNLGAITRSMAQFGLKFMVGEAGQLPAICSSWARISQGGLEDISVVTVNNKLKALADLKQKGYNIYGVSHRAKTSCSLSKFIFKVPFGLVLGSELTGLSQEILPLLDETILIPGTGIIESLNVSSAAAICFYEYFKQSDLTYS